MKTLIFGLLVLLIFPSLAMADIISPGEKQLDFCYNITNIDSYPDYVFLIHGSMSPTREIMVGECFSFYKYGRPEVFAVKKIDYELGPHDNSFFSTNKVIPSGFQLSGMGSTSIFNPLDKVTTLLEIVSLNETKLEIKKTNVINTYIGGLSNEKSGQQLPNILYIIIPIAAIVAIVLILVFRKK